MDRTKGDAMTSLLALLCLGLSVGTRTLVKAGTVPRPILWAEPGSVVLCGTSVTLWCRGNVGAQQFHLVKIGISPPWETYLTLEQGNKAKFPVPLVTREYAGTYKCSYLNLAGWSESSDPLELVVAGLRSKPSLSAFPSPVVASGQTFSLQCDSWLEFDTFVLTQEGDPQSPWKLGSQRLPSGQRQALFRIGPGPLRHRWSIRCYGLFSHTPHEWSHPSDPLQLLVTGASKSPSLLSLYGQIVTPGQTPILQCHSKKAYDTFALYKEESQDIRQHPGHRAKNRLSLVNFTLGPMSAFSGGRYRCIGRTGFTSLWSEPSDPIDIFVAEQLPNTQTLSVEPGPSVSPGDNVTLLCQSRGWRDTFLLSKEGAADPPQRIKVNMTEEITQTQFSFHPVNSTHNGTYRCYSSNSISPYRLSCPSVPLHLWVLGPSVDSRTMSTTGMEPLLIGLSTTGALLGLFLLLFLLLFFRHRRQAGHRRSGATHPAPQDTGLHSSSRPSAHIQKDSPGDSYREDGWLRVQGPRGLGQGGAAAQDISEDLPGHVPAPLPTDTVNHTQSEEGVRLNPQSRQDEDPHGATYAQVKHVGFRHREASCTPLSGPRQNAQDRQTEDTQAGGQTEAPEAPLEVTYAQLKHLDIAQETTAPPSSLSGEPPEEPSVYAALAFHYPSKDSAQSRDPRS